MYSNTNYTKLTPGWHTLLRLNSTTVYVPIPKNAHTWMLRSFNPVSETQTNLNDRYLVILRDPIERWITGIGTYCGNNHYFKREFHSNHLPNWQLFFSYTLIPDGHTVPQTYFLRNVSPQSMDIFTVNNNLRSQISSYLNREPLVSQANVAENSGYHRYIINNLRVYLNSNPQVLAELHKIYTEDFQLINTHKAIDNAT